MFYLILGVVIGNAIGIGLLLIDHLLWLKYARKDGDGKTWAGYGFILAIKHLIKR